MIRIFRFFQEINQWGGTSKYLTENVTNIQAMVMWRMSPYLGDKAKDICCHIEYLDCDLYA